ncbi:hypothetical protein TBLA_0E00680 [Henningerozyma blattae CBS 6284]|uniref:Eukaryotic translation initiation factor 3 subunit B n=1 Tax=Henningerozyma blattae (strain ATCC 34711 / CBS 6284 / DSM 70876 / NBRC 10599 / NRRL Y-10934 / UCD 77-7) TaxID=1071380 RepID=I2H427_HENB6|nr:hypothetical protein TBLA_0E00680 [Tetrapisispora blattae CBS 6284]CCH61129.1 hypothetical protein TBLA_0E00680 [Tetrapisispora blattae CBS 6284]
MTSAVEGIKLEDINVDDIDFSDLEKQYGYEDKFSIDQYVVVTGIPIIPEAKVPVLKKALTGLFSKAGKVVDMEFPLDEETKKTKGFLFVECGSPVDGNKIIKTFHTKRLDLKHRLYLYSMKDVEKFNGEGFDPEFKEPEIPPFVSSSFLKSWLLDEMGRDQYVVQNANLTSVFWNDKSSNDIQPVESRQKWSSNYIKFSSKGTLMFSYHTQGVVAWGGETFERLRRFYHPNVRTCSISPNEKFLVTFSSDLIVVDADDEECPFTKKNEGHQLCIWDISTGLLLNTFPVVKSPFLQWPLVRWSYDDKYCARMVGDTLVVHDSNKSFAAMEGKALRVKGIRDFSFAPAGVKLAPFRNGSDPSVLLAYWTPETNNMSCKATIVEVPRGRVLKTVNLVQVSNVSIHWQNNAEYLCFNVERHTKSKKTSFSNLEICKLTEKDIPVDKIELKNSVNSFEFEPNGDRFVTIETEDTGDDNPAVPRNIASFYAFPKSESKGPIKNNLTLKWKMFYQTEKKFSNIISWSPAGRFVVVGTIATPSAPNRKAELIFYDFDFAGDKPLNKIVEVNSNLKELSKPSIQTCTNLSWDPSGRYLTAWSSSLKLKSGSGFKIFNVVGDTIKEDPVPQLKNFTWRPRPELSLSSSEKKKVKKNLREYSAQFEEQDAMEADSAMRDLILRQRELLKEWNEYRSSINEELESSGIKNDTVDDKDEDDYTTITEIKEEIIKEKEEIVNE